MWLKSSKSQLKELIRDVAFRRRGFGIRSFRHSKDYGFEAVKDFKPQNVPQAQLRRGT
jgi:hypothetical protein